MPKRDDLYTAVGARIRKAREERGLTQDQLATVIAFTRASITNIEHGRQKLLLHTLFDIANALEIEPATLLPRVADLVEPGDLAQRLPPDLTPVEQVWFRSLVSAREKVE